MKKGILKKLTPTVIVPVLVVLSAFGLAGCEMSCNSPSSYRFKENQFIVYQNTLHKGDLIATLPMGDGGIFPTPDIRLNCGITRTTSQFVASETRPSESEYEFVCDVCFH